MLTVKFYKYQGEPGHPSSTSSLVIHPAKMVYIEYDKHNRSVVGIITPAGEREDFTVGETGRDDVMFNTAYIMNEAGKTVEALR